MDANPSFARLIGWEAQSGARGLADGAMQATAVTEALRAVHGVRRERGLADFDPALVSVALVSMCFTSADFAEGVESFLARRPPVWQGR